MGEKRKTEKMRSTNKELKNRGDNTLEFDIYIYIYMRLSEDFIRDVNAFFKTKHETIGDAIEQVYAQVDRSPDRPMRKDMEEMFKKYDQVEYIEKGLLESLRLVDLADITRWKNILLLFGLLEPYKAVKDESHIPNETILNLNVGIMGVASFISLPGQYEDFQLWIAHSIGLVFLGMSPPDVKNAFELDDERYNKVYIYLLLSSHLSNDMYQKCRIEGFQCLLEPMKYENYLWHRYLMVGCVNNIIYQTVDKRQNYMEERDGVWGYSYGANEEARKNCKLALHFARLGMDELGKRMYSQR